MLKFTLVFLVLLLTAVSVLGAPYTGCDDPSLDTQGKNCVEVTACQELDAANTYYLLMNNVSADDSCILVNNIDITFDLNDYTVFYAANPSNYQSNTYAPATTDGCIAYNGFHYGTVCHHGISDMQVVSATRVGGTPDWYGYTRRSCDRVEITNGRIEQVDIDASYSDGIRMNCRDAEIHDIYWYGNGNDTMGLSLGLAGGGTNAHVHNNTFVSDSVFVSNRHQTPAIIKTVYGDNWDIHHNTIIGGPCIGMALSDGNQIYNNDVSQKQYNDNAYSLRIGSNNDVYYNYFHPQDGRGILMDSTHNNTIHHNTIEVLERGTTRTYGLRIRTWGVGGATNNKVYNNNITAFAGVPGLEGHATAIVLSLFTEGNIGNEIVNNTIRGITYNAAYQADGLGFDGARWLNVSFDAPKVEDNIFTGNSNLIDTLQNPGNQMAGNQYTFTNNQFIRETIGDPNFALIRLDAYSDNQAEEFTFLNPSFTNTDFDDVVWVRCSAPYSGTCSYDVEWWLDINVENQDGTQLTGAAVTVTDNLGTVVYSGTTTDGEIPTLHPKEYYEHSITGRETYTPYTITATYDGNQETSVIDLTSSRTETIVITTGPCTEGNTRQCGASDVGACSYGTQTCTSGTWGSCVGEVIATTEVCGNSLDDDCDSLTDYDDTNDCTVPECSLPGDVAPCDVIEAGELVNAVLAWYAGTTDVTTLLTVVDRWRIGGGQASS